MQNQTKLLIRDFIVLARVGIYPREHEKPQRVRISLDVTLQDAEIKGDRIENTVSYEGLVAAIRNLNQQHFNLVETLAEYLASVALKDSRVHRVTVTVEKLDVYLEGRVGVEMTRNR